MLSQQANDRLCLCSFGGEPETCEQAACTSFLPVGVLASGGCARFSFVTFREHPVYKPATAPVQLMLCRPMVLPSVSWKSAMKPCGGMGMRSRTTLPPAGATREITASSLPSTFR